MKVDNVVVLGLGAAGANLIMNLIYDLPEASIFGLDYDLVEPRNYLAGTQPYKKMHVGKTKVQAMGMILNMEGKKFTGRDMKICREQDLLVYLSNIIGTEKHTLLIDAFDNPDARNLTHRFFEKLGYKKNTELLHLGFSEHLSGEVMWDSSWEEMGESKSTFDICTQEGAKSFITALTSLASLVITEYNFHGLKRNLYFDKFFKLRSI